MNSKSPANRPSAPPSSPKVDVSPDLATMVALQGLQAVWGCSMGYAVTCVLDSFAERALVEGMELQEFIAQAHPEWAGKPLLTVPRHVFMAGIHAQELAEARAEGQA